MKLGGIGRALPGMVEGLTNGAKTKSATTPGIGGSLRATGLLSELKSRAQSGGPPGVRRSPLPGSMKRDGSGLANHLTGFGQKTVGLSSLMPMAGPVMTAGQDLMGVGSAAASSAADTAATLAIAQIRRKQAMTSALVSIEEEGNHMIKDAAKG